MNRSRQYNIYLGKAEEESHATAELEGIVDGLFKFVQARLTHHAGRRGSRGVDIISRATGFLNKLQKTNEINRKWAMEINKNRPYITSNVRVPCRVESTALEGVLNLLLQFDRSMVPSTGRQIPLLVLAHGQTGAGYGELNEEQHEQNDHVLQGGLKELLG